MFRLRFVIAAIGCGRQGGLRQSAGKVPEQHDGRKQIALLGVALVMPAAPILGMTPSIEVLIDGRIFGGLPLAWSA